MTLCFSLPRPLAGAFFRYSTVTRVPLDSSRDR